MVEMIMMGIPLTARGIVGSNARVMRGGSRF